MTDSKKTPPKPAPTPKPKPTTPTQPKLSSRLEKFVNMVSARIMGVTMTVTLVLVVIMSAQLWYLNQPPTVKAIDSLDTITGQVSTVATQDEGLDVGRDEGRDLLARLVLEHDAQYLRTKRGQSLVAAKLFTHALAIMAGILMMTMGSSFVFARIQTAENNFDLKFPVKFDLKNATPTEIAEVKKQQSSLVFSSYSPGLFFAFFGTILIIVALLTSISKSIEVTDTPVFLQNLNSSAYTNTNKSSLRNSGGKYDPAKECEVIKATGGHCD